MACVVLRTVVTQDLELRARRLKERLDNYRQSPSNVPASDTEVSYMPRDSSDISVRLAKVNHVAHNKTVVTRNGPRNSASSEGGTLLIKYPWQVSHNY
jgi:hypothetical protein